jgi:hypothetical protein
MKKEYQMLKLLLAALLLLSSCGGPARKESEDPTSKSEVQKDFYGEIRYVEPAYPELIALYNGGHFREFYQELDTIQTEYRFTGESDLDDSSQPAYPIFSVEIQEDSAHVRQLVFDANMKLMAIGINQTLTKGTYTVEYDYDKLFDETGPGLYYLYIRVGTEERLMRIPVLK